MQFLKFFQFRNFFAALQKQQQITAETTKIWSCNSPQVIQSIHYVKSYTFSSPRKKHQESAFGNIWQLFFKSGLHSLAYCFKVVLLDSDLIFNTFFHWSILGYPLAWKMCCIWRKLSHILFFSP